MIAYFAVAVFAVAVFAVVVFSLVSPAAAAVLELGATLRCCFGLAGVACGLVSAFTSLTSLVSVAAGAAAAVAGAGAGGAAAGSSFLPFTSLAFGFSLILHNITVKNAFFFL